MEPFEVMTSESQERMLAIVDPDDLDEVLGLCERWEVRATVVGRVTDGRPRCASSTASTAPVLADVPASSLHDAAPLYDRPVAAAGDRQPAETDPASVVPAPTTRAPTCSRMLADTGWVWRQYDHQLFLNTVEGPGGDATVLRLKDPRTGPRHRPGPGPHHRRQPPLVRRRPPAAAPPASSPRRCSTWPASAPGRSPSSTASTSATPSTPR